MARSHILPSKVNVYLQRLLLEYERSGQKALTEMLRNARLSVIPEAHYYDDYDAGSYGHDIHFFLAAETIQRIPLKKQRELGEEICQDLNECARSVQGEYFREVVLELEDENDPLFQSSTGSFRQPPPDPDSLKIWKTGYVRLFISHKDSHKIEAKSLADSLEEYGVSTFVAHDNIEPMSTWQGEIEKALATMEIMLAFVTDDFHDGFWTNQEIGYALGKQIPIIPVKLERADPMGFIGKVQALRGRLDDPQASASAVFDVIGDKLGQRTRLQRALIAAFTTSPDFNETIRRFKRLDSSVQSLTNEEFAEIAEGFAVNNQLHNCGYLVNQSEGLQKFLTRCMGKAVHIEGTKILLTTPPPDDDIPF
jgi:hypothetical protein